ncbi:MAG: hypothetical protein ACD_41C00058G0006 [uncultured bacterium]|nr:MAG: hypothetical protein ACD_41C00058G0006 [uncultured bacterium]HBY73961.1 hypothetical protein [Candidatus Kerfeldbacteria bacterium]
MSKYDRPPGDKPIKPKDEGIRGKIEENYEMVRVVREFERIKGQYLANYDDLIAEHRDLSRKILGSQAPLERNEMGAHWERSTERLKRLKQVVQGMIDNCTVARLALEKLRVENHDIVQKYELNKSIEPCIESFTRMRDQCLTTLPEIEKMISKSQGMLELHFQSLYDHLNKVWLREKNIRYVERLASEMVAQKIMSVDESHHILLLLKSSNGIEQ